MWWAIIFLPLVLSAQTVRIVMPDTLPARLSLWSRVPGELIVTSTSQRAVRIRAWLKREDLPLITVPFAALPITIVGDTLRIPIRALIADMIASAEPFFLHNRLPGGTMQLCVELCDVNDSTQRIGEPRCRQFFVVGVPPIELVEPQQTILLATEATVKFRWRTYTAPIESIMFHLRVAERRRGQSRWYALVANPPVWMCKQPSTGHTEWECSMPVNAFRRGGQYVWGIFVVESDGSEELVSPVGEFNVQ